MNILFLRGFNNYFNRIVKKYSDLNDYKTNSTSYVEYTSINFNPNDGVVTELIIGNENQKENSAPLAWDINGTPDYAICYEMEGSPAAPAIKFRWFVLESERTRSGQYRLALKRDVIAEHLGIIKQSPCFIEKGMINDIDDPLLYNKESMTFNQIKQAEIPLKDATNSGWIVGYVAQNAPTSQNVIQDGIKATILKESDPAEFFIPSELPFSTSNADETIGIIDSVKLSLPVNYVSALKVSGGGLSETGEAKVSIRMYNLLMNLNESTGISSKSTSFSDKVEYYSDSWGRSSNATLNHSYDGTGLGLHYVLSGDLQNQNIYNPYIINYIMPNSYAAYSYAPLLSMTEYGTGSWHSYYDTTGQTNFTNNINNMSSSQSTILNTKLSNYVNSIMSRFEEQYSYTDVITGNASTIINRYNNKYVKIENKYYLMNFTAIENKDYLNYSSNLMSAGGQNASVFNASTDNTNKLNDLRDTVFGIVSDNTFIREYHDDLGSVYATPHIYKYRLTLSPYETETLHIADRAYTDRTRTYDNYVDMFAIPYSDDFIFTHSNATIRTKKIHSLAMARAIATRFGNSCYDLQYVPYCPVRFIREIYESGDTWSTADLDTSTYQIMDVTGAGGTTSNCGIVFWCVESKGEFDITLELLPDVYYEDNQIESLSYSNVLNYKVNNEVQLCRLASPNFNGQFEFSLPKNKGVTKFNVDFTYKPYMPYIHVNPDFKEFYGQDWNDARGLICAGNFSLGFINDAWINYQNNNKNYKQIFDRQIQNMDVNNAIAMEQQKFQGTVGTITSAINGVIKGGAAGATAGGVAGPIGAVVGGVAGAIGGGVGSGLASAYGAKKDIDWLDRQQQEARSYAIDMYGYQLGNIQAMPYSINGTESLTNNNKIYPIIEIYEPKEKEIDLLLSKIEFNGMTVMAVGKIEDYCSSDYFNRVFIKGQIIRLESDELNDDFHIADAIYQEIDKGIYISQGGN